MNIKDLDYILALQTLNTEFNTVDIFLQGLFLMTTYFLPKKLEMDGKQRLATASSHRG